MECSAYDNNIGIIMLTCSIIAIGIGLSIFASLENRAAKKFGGQEDVGHKKFSDGLAIISGMTAYAITLGVLMTIIRNLACP